MAALKAMHGPGIEFRGVGGFEMAAQGLPSLFRIDDLAIVGFAAIPGRLPLIISRIRQTARAVIAEQPDVLVIIDSPDFTHRVARRVRRARPNIPIVDYVSPSVWAWRPGRARAMRRYIDHVLALLPFEPDVHRKLGGPPCTYVGHPLVEQIDELRPNAQEAARRNEKPPVLLVLPGSRKSEIRRLGKPFARAVERIAKSVWPRPRISPTSSCAKPRTGRCGRALSSSARSVARRYASRVPHSQNQER
jgi:lipid-A-disaccharide synthase